MWAGADRHAELAAELDEWLEDLWWRHTGSQVVLVQVPSGWGRTTILDQFEMGIASREEVPVTIAIRVNGEDLPGEVGLQARAVRDLLAPAIERHRAAELLGGDRAGGAVQLGLGAAGLLFSGLTAGVSFLVAGLAVGAAGKAWDESPAGQDGALARAARAVAAVSVQAPVVVILDDADKVDQALAVLLIENLAARHNGQVLVVATMDPGSGLAQELVDRSRFGLTEELVHAAEADPDMGYESRLELARQLCPYLLDAAVRRVASRTATFAEVFSVATAPRLAALSEEPGVGEGEMLAVVDATVNGRLARPAPSQEAAVLAWVGGLAHARQVDRALDILGAARADNDPDVRRWVGVARLADPASPRVAELATVELSPGQRRGMAAALLEEALGITSDTGCGLVERAAALLAAYRVRDDLASRDRLPRAQRELAAALESLGDYTTASDVAATALGEWPPGAGGSDDLDVLQATVLRLSRLAPQASVGLLAEQLITDAIEGGAVPGLEARVWAAAALLDTPGQREAALDLTGRVMTDLDARPDLGEAGDRWRLLLAHRTARAGHPGLAGQLLAPLLISDDPDWHRAAHAILDAGDGPRADIRLQNILLADELAALAAGADDDRLRLHYALAANYAILGYYHQALEHGKHELQLRTHVQGPGNPDTLTARFNVMNWTGCSGDAGEALRLAEDLLPDQERLGGPHHPNTLVTRAAIARWTGQSGDAARALALYQDLLPDQVRVLGPDHPHTLTTRAEIACWTGRSGDAAAALALYRDLLPDQIRILGPDHPDTLTTRANIARFVGECGDAARALALYQDLLPERIRVLGPDHPRTLTTRAEIAYLTGQCGDAAAALALYRDLLPDQIRVLGPDHPDTLTARAGMARWTGRHGDAAAALALYRDLLPERVRVLGRDHPDTLSTRGWIAYWTGLRGDLARGLALYQDLLPDQERVLGPDHPITLTARGWIAYWTGLRGDLARGLALYQELLGDQIRVLGPAHLSTLTARDQIARLTGEKARQIPDDQEHANDR